MRQTVTIPMDGAVGEQALPQWAASRKNPLLNRLCQR
jgi:hypothetical protein